MFPLVNQWLVHLYSTLMTDALTYLPKTQLMIVLALDQNVSTLIAYPKSSEEHMPLCLFPW